jgi:oligopeptide transport system permease protein
LSTLTAPISEPIRSGPRASTVAPAGDSAWSRAMRSPRVVVGGLVLLLITLTCLVTLPWTLDAETPLYYDRQLPAVRQPPSGGSFVYYFGTDTLGRSIIARCLLGGAISLAIGLAAAAVSVVLGVSVGLLAGYRGGWLDSLLMRMVDVMYGLPYILLVILFKVAFQGPLSNGFEWVRARTGWSFSAVQLANLVVLFAAIGLVSWLTLARVVRGQVLSLRGQPFIEAARAMGLPQRRIFIRHILPNLVGPIIVYATLTIPQAILQESFLSFLGVGINPPLATWGSLAAEGLVPTLNPINPRWWMLLFPCLLLVVTLLSLNFLGDGLRDVFDPKREAAKI